MKRVFLGGTESGSVWRDELIPMLKINHSSPIPTAHSKEIVSESQERGLADFVLHVLTPKTDNFEALDIIAKAVQNSNRTPAKTVLCVLSEDGGIKFDAKGRKILRWIMETIQGNGAQVFESLEGLASYLNSFYVDPAYEPDVVECLIQRDGQTVVTLGKTRYIFKKNEAGHSVCKVIWKEHREHLLKLGDFRLYLGEIAPDLEFTDIEWDFMREWKLLGADRFLAYVNSNIKQFNQSRGKIKAIAIGKWKALLPKMGCPISLEAVQDVDEDSEFVAEWLKLDGVQFGEYVTENEGHFRQCSAAILEKAQAKWDRVVFAKTGEPWPLVLETNV